MPSIESLEVRRLLSSALTVTIDAAGDGGDTLVVSGSDGTDRIEVTETGGTVAVMAGPLGGPLETFGPWANVSHVVIHCRGGGDAVDYLGTTAGALICLGDGHDLLEVSDTGSGRSVAFGGPGDDVMNVVYGNGTALFGNAGNDTLLGPAAYDPTYNPGAHTLLFGGTGDDTLFLFGPGSFADGGEGLETAGETGGD